LALELQSLVLYVLASFCRSSAFSAEAGLKYFILGALSSGLYLFGAVILYGYTGTLQFDALSLLLADITNYPLDQFVMGIIPGVVFMLSGLFFKM
jgi:NADH-quinone oxidoreductase subunit N